MQTQEIKAQSNTETRQWEVSHFMPTDRGVMAFVPAGSESLDETETPIKVLQFMNASDIVGLECKGIIIPLDASLLEHLINAGQNNDGKALVSIISLSAESWIAMPLVGFEVTVEELEQIKELLRLLSCQNQQ